MNKHNVNRHTGFTIVELLIVIVIIAILAALTFVAFNGLQQQARVSAVNAALSQAKRKLLSYQVENGNFPLTGNLSAAGVNDNDSTKFQYTSSGPSYCLTATNGSTSYKTTDTTNSVSGGCPGHSQGGVAAITNLAMNPAATAYNTTSQAQYGWRNDRWNSNGTYSIVSNASDGPTPQLKTYARFTFTQAIAQGRGFHNVGNPETTVPNGNGAAVTPGTTYTFSAYFRSSNNNGTAGIGIRYVDNSDAWLGGTVAGSLPSLSGGWTRVSVTSTAPGGAAKVQVYTIQAAGSTHAIGDTLDGTGLMVTEGSTLYGYADGGSSDWIWNGTANGSTSTGPPQ